MKTILGANLTNNFLHKVCSLHQVKTSSQIIQYMTKSIPTRCHFSFTFNSQPKSKFFRVLHNKKKRVLFNFSFSWILALWVPFSEGNCQEVKIPSGKASFCAGINLCFIIPSFLVCNCLLPVSSVGDALVIFFIQLLVFSRSTHQ